MSDAIHPYVQGLNFDLSSIRQPVSGVQTSIIVSRIFLGLVFRWDRIRTAVAALHAYTCLQTRAGHEQPRATTACKVSSG